MGIRHNVDQWTFDTDVVVVGSGGCGLVAALAAAQGGVEVVVFEKQQRPWSNTARSGSEKYRPATSFPAHPVWQSGISSRTAPPTTANPGRPPGSFGRRGGVDPRALQIPPDPETVDPHAAAG